MNESRRTADDSSLGHEPDGAWAFDAEVTRVFGDMLKRSIPQYAEMRELVTGTGRQFVQPGTDIIDLGCSKGDALAPFVTEFGDRCRYLGLEIAAPMLAAARERFAAQIEAGLVRIEQHSLLDAYPAVRASLTLCVLTLQFVPPQHRARILSEVQASTLPGGALVLVEKVVGAGPQLDRLMVDLHHELKARHGYTREEIDRKRLSLEGVLVPLTAADNEAMLREAGFNQIDCFWRWMNFAGWIALP